MDSIITRSEAKILGRPRYFTGQPCKHGHIAERNTKDRCCVECRKRISNEANKRFRVINPEKQKRRAHESYERHKEDYIRRARLWEKENPERAAELQNNWRRSEKGKAQSRSWVAENQETHAAFTKSWKSRNPGKVNEYTGTRRAARLNATPAWLTPEDRTQIRHLYIEAKRLGTETSIRHHVDHVIPLQGETVCGLHVPWNLQILTENENAAKGNRIITDFC